MYAEHDLFISPSDEAVLWRYMDLPKFLSMLEKRALFFARADKLGDPFEGSFSRANELLRPSLYGEGSEDLTRVYSEYMKSLTRFTLINCWHQNDVESQAMWRLYSRGQDGVAVKTTFKNLKDCLTGSEPIYVGRVNYVDYSTEFIREDNAFGPYLYKRKSFEHEREIRAVFQKTPDENKPVPLRNDICEIGINVDVDVDTLIQEVVVDQRADDWLLELVELLVARYGIEAPVVRSALGEPPFW